MRRVPRNAGSVGQGNQRIIERFATEQKKFREHEQGDMNYYRIGGEAYGRKKPCKITSFKEVNVMYGFTFTSTTDRFRLLHSEIIEEFQCIEYDMRRIYSSMIDDDFYEVMEEMSDKNWGVILNRLRKLDYSDDNPYFTHDEYELLDEIRELRNYWCHQCYLDFVYIMDSWKREEKLQKLIRRLENELNRVRRLQERIQERFLRDFV